MTGRDVSTVLLLWLSSALLSLPASGYAGPQTQLAPAEHEAQLQRLRSRIGGLRDQIKKNRGEQGQLTHQLEEAEQKIGRLARRLRVLEGRLSRQRTKRDELQQQEKRQVRALADEREMLARQLRAAYATGRQERIKLMLNQEDPGTLSRVLAYYDYLNRARARRVRSIHQQLEQLTQTRQRLAQEEQRLFDLKQKYAGEKQILENAQLARRAVIDALDREYNSQGSQLARLQNDEAHLQSLLSGLREALSDIPDQAPGQMRFNLRKGRLAWPSSGLLSVNYGTPKIGKLRWDGVMISAPEGREVKAVHHGRVAFADWLRGFGLLLIIDHGDGYMTLYGHNQSLFKEVGDWVAEGEAIGLVGSSGGRTQSGVYFGIRHQGKPVDPAHWCRRPQGRRVG